MKKILMILVGVILLSPFVFADTLDVNISDVGCSDGTGTPYCTIQAAIDDASAGNTINVSSGTYEEELIINKSLSLIGSPGNSPGPGPNAPVLDGEGVEGSAITLEDGVSNVLIQGFEITDYANPGCCTGGIGSGILAWNADTSNITIKDNYLHDLGWNGVLVGSDDGSIQTGWLVQENIIEDSSYAGIELTNVVNSKVLDNDIIIGSGIAWDPDDSGVGIEVAVRDHGTGVTAGTNVVVEGNEITGDGITPERAGINILSRAYADSSSSLLQDVTIKNNSVTGATRGVYVVAESRNDGDTTIDDLLIENNTLDSNEEGIVIYDFINGGNSATHEDITIINNKILDSTGIASGIHINSGTSANEIEVHFNYIVNNSLYGINNNGTGTLNATYNYWGSCDGPGSVGTGSGDNVTTDVLFDPWIGICITEKIEAICKFETNNITLGANVTSLENVLQIEKVWISYNINGTNFNKTATNTIGDAYFATIDSSELVGGQNITWTVYVNDTLGFVFKNGLEIFYVRNKTSLTVDPEIPDGSNDWYVTEPEFSLFKDVNGTATYYIWNTHPDGPILYSTPFGLDNITNAPPKESAGILDLNWWSTFSCGNETIQTELFHVDLTDPSIIALSPENGSTVINNQKPVIKARLEETFAQNSGIDIEIVQMSLTGTPVLLVVGKTINQTGIDAIIEFTPTFYLPIGENNVTINVTDNAGRNSEVTWFFTIINTTAFSMNVNSPENKTYDKRRIPFNISLNGEVKILQYINYNDRRPRLKTLCRNCDGYGFDRSRTKSLKEGENKIGIRATDNLGQSKEENITFFIDSKDPRISRTEPRRRSVTNGSDFYIKYTEDNVKELLLSWNPELDLTSQCNSPGRNQECSFNIDLTGFDGQEIEYWFNMTDIAGNTKSSRVTKVLVDITSPVLTVNSPENKTGIDSYGRRVSFNITISEDVKLEYSDNGARFRRLCSRCDEYGFDRSRTKSFRNGIHEVIIRATDKAGNSDIEKVRFEVIR